MSSNGSVYPLLMDRTVPFVNELFCILESNGSESHAEALLIQAEKEHQLELSTIQPYPRPKSLPDEFYKEYVEERLYSFWSATHLVLGDADASKLFLIFSDEFLCSMGIREWAVVQARWANRNVWLSHSNWSYADFTGGPNDLIIANYNSWSRLAMRILTSKSSHRIEAVKQNFAKLVEKLTQNEDIEERLNIVTTIAGLGTPEAKALLEKILRRESNERLVGSINYYLSILKSGSRT